MVFKIRSSHKDVFLKKDNSKNMTKIYENYPWRNIAFINKSNIAFKNMLEKFINPVASQVNKMSFKSRSLSVSSSDDKFFS